ncbi:hypothetical protein [Streptomyces goshikiensis]|uniref:hypothetical protein n=1 Tax=Streptomyces goshikiensis TaxID=1942 RepID=UPI0036BF7118
MQEATSGYVAVWTPDSGGAAVATIRCVSGTDALSNARYEVQFPIYDPKPVYGPFNYNGAVRTLEMVASISPVEARNAVLDAFVTYGQQARMACQAPARS